MQSKRRRRSAASSDPKPTGTLRSETLAAFGQLLDNHAGEEVGLAAAVETLYAARYQARALAAARKVLLEKVKAAHALGVVSVPGTPYLLKETSPGRAQQYLAVPSNVAKSANKPAWQRAHVAKSWAQVQPPVVAAARLQAAVTLDIPDVSRMSTLTLAATAYREHPAWERLKKLYAEEKTAKERLEKIAADHGWDGLPLTFADGWVIGLRREQYSSERLAEIEPEMFDRLAELKIKQFGPRVYVALPDEDDEMGEIDEWDGD
jgi:hypothetical protein